VLAAEKAAVAEAHECRQALETLVKDERAKNYFRGLNDELQKHRLLETLRSNVELCHREKDIERLHEQMNQERAEFEKIRQGLLEEIRVLTLDLHETREAFRMTHENYQQDHMELRATQRVYREQKALFDKYRKDAQAFVDRVTLEQALEESKHAITFSMAVNATNTLNETKREMEVSLREAHRVSQQRLERAETWQMAAEDMESRQFEIEEALAAGRPQTTNSNVSRASAKKDSKKESKKKKKKGDGDKAGKKGTSKKKGGKKSTIVGSSGDETDLDGALSPLSSEGAFSDSPPGTAATSKRASTAGSGEDSKPNKKGAKKGKKRATKVSSASSAEGDASSAGLSSPGNLELPDFETVDAKAAKGPRKTKSAGKKKKKKA